MKKNIYFDLFSTFFKIGAFTFGGGYAMIPLIEREVIDNKNWVDEEELLDILALSQSVPGVIAVNSAIFIGYRTKGIAGAVAACIGVMLPSFIIISLIATYFMQFREHPVFDRAFTGIRAAVVALIVSAVIKLGKAGIKDYQGLILAIMAFILIIWVKINAIWVVIGGAVAGILLNNKQRGNAS
ncbi:MAG: chromate transporter [Clostridia bacterium]|nr:chromate transporter [Clostridia bacterium]